MHYALVLLALGGLLALHELGHLVAARLCGVRVPRFVFGFGPPLVSFRLWGTQYVLAAVPLGATAHVQGMNPHRADAAEDGGFQVLGPLRRMVIILAGPLANYLLALGLLFSLYTSGTHVVVPLTVGTVQPGSEAARAQLLPGDRIVTVAGQPLKNWSEFVEQVARSPGRPLELGVERQGTQRTVQVRPRPDERGEGRIGVSQQYVYRAHGAGEALGHAFAHTGSVAAEGLSTLVRLVRGPEHTGAVGPGALMRQESSDAASSGMDSLMRALVTASVALALLMMLPVPGLDGGRVALLMVEAASGRRLPPRVETVAQAVGFLGIAAVIVVVAGMEIRRALPERPAPAVVGGTPTASAGAPANAAGSRPTAGPGAPANAAGGATTAPGAPAPVVGATSVSGPGVAANATAAGVTQTLVPGATPSSAPPTTPAAPGAAAAIAPAPGAPRTGANPVAPTPAAGTAVSGTGAPTGSTPAPGATASGTPDAGTAVAG
ncbi:PDZ domain-containing protein, partial [Pyxidicoccus fallax]